MNPFQKLAKMPGEAVMLKQVENIANIEILNEISKISCELKEKAKTRSRDGRRLIICLNRIILARRR